MKNDLSFDTTNADLPGLPAALNDETFLRFERLLRTNHDELVLRLNLQDDMLSRLLEPGGGRLLDPGGLRLPEPEGVRTSARRTRSRRSTIDFDWNSRNSTRSLAQPPTIEEEEQTNEGEVARRSRHCGVSGEDVEVNMTTSWELSPVCPNGSRPNVGEARPEPAMKDAKRSALFIRSITPGLESPPLAAVEAVPPIANERSPRGATSEGTTPSDERVTGDLQMEDAADDRRSDSDNVAWWKASEKSLDRRSDGDVMRSKTSLGTNMTGASMRSSGPWSLKELTKTFKFELFFVVAILFNGLLIGAEVQWQSVERTEETLLGFQVMSDVLSILFLIELVLRVAAWRLDFFCGTGLRWNYFDLVLVLTSMLEMIINFVNSISEKRVEKSGMSNLRIIRIVRITRLVRLLRIARILRLVKGFRVLVLSIGNSLKSVMWALFLLLIIIYVFSIAFTQSVNSYLVKRIKEGEFEGDSWTDDLKLLMAWEMYGSMQRSMYTLFQVASQGRNWHEAAEPLYDVSPFWLFLFLAFVAFIFFAVLNVVTGVFCQSAIDSANRDREMVIQSLLENKQTHVRNIRKQFQSLFNRTDGDDAGAISIEEFERHIHDERVHGFFVLLDIDTSDAYALFRLLDDDCSGAIDAEEFVEGCLRLQGVARSIDLAKVRHENKFMMQKIATYLAEMENSSVDFMNSTSSALGALNMQVAAVLDATSRLSRAAAQTAGNSSHYHQPRSSASSSLLPRATRQLGPTCEPAEPPEGQAPVTPRTKATPLL